MSGDLTQVQGGDELRRAQQMSMQRTRPPTEVPGYEAEECLGAGAYGEVWVAVDRNTGRRVAIKFYSQRGGVDWSQLAREVEKLAFLTGDRYVVQLIEVGWQSDPPYYVMEYMEYGSLEDRLGAGPMPVHDALAVVRDVSIGLVHAHGKGVLHCDLKPANVLLDQDSKPRLADFGQSRLTHEQAPALGTLFYMAPEQADMTASPDAGWDVYALGALLYRMLTGDPPYKTREFVERIEKIDALEERLKVYRDSIRKAPRPTAHRKTSGVDKALSDIIDRCLSVDPRKRFPNAQAVLDALDARTARRARRPLLIMGALGPALLMGVMGLFAMQAFSTAVNQSTSAVTARALDGQRFAAQFVAQAYARGMEQRFRAVEQAAADPTLAELLSTHLKSPEFLALVAQQQDPSLTPAQKAAARDALAVHPLQRWLQEELLDNPGLPRSASWFLTDEIGTQIARAPLGDDVQIGKNYAFRDYFSGRDMPPGDRSAEMINSPHRSHAFLSTTSNQLVVAFSAPIRIDGKKQALIAMTVELGKFAELGHQRASETPDESKAAAGQGEKNQKDQGSQVAVLVDNSTENRGQLLQHPLFEAVSELVRALGEEERKALRKIQQELAEAVVSDDTMRQVPPADQARMGDPVSTLDYRDPLLEALHAKHAELAAATRTAVAGRSATGKALIEAKLQAFDQVLQQPLWTPSQRWLAALDGVVVKGRTDWVVVVQEPYAVAVAPVEELRTSLFWTGVWGVSLSAVVLTGLWGVVSMLLYGGRMSWLRRLRRTVGLPSDSLSTGTSRSGASSRTGTSSRGASSRSGGQSGGGSTRTGGTARRATTPEPPKKDGA